MKNLKFLAFVLVFSILLPVSTFAQQGDSNENTGETEESTNTKQTEDTGDSGESDESDDTGESEDSDESDESDTWDTDTWETVETPKSKVAESESTGELPGNTGETGETETTDDKSVRFKVTFSDTDKYQNEDSDDSDDSNESDDSDDSEETSDTDSDETDWTNETNTDWTDETDETDWTDPTDDTNWTNETGETFTHSHDFDTDYRRKNKRNVSTRWFMLDLGLNDFVVEGEFETPPSLSEWELEPIRSFEVNLHIVQQRVNLIAHHVNLAYGLSLFWNRYEFENRVRLTEGIDQVELVSVQEDDPNFVQNYDRNRLGTTMIAFPVMLNFETRPFRKGQSFHLNVGGYVGQLIETNLKQHSDEFGKIKIKDDFNLNKWNYGLMAQLGYGALNFYVKASGNELFRDNSGGPEIYRLSFGVSIVYY